MCQAQILFNSGNLPSGVSQPASPRQEVPGGLGGIGRARREASLPGSLSPSHGPHVPCPEGLENCITCRVLCVGRGELCP